MTDESTKRVLKKVYRDKVAWLLYECDGEPATLVVGEIRGITGGGGPRNQSQLDRGGSCNMCDSSTGEVLHVLGWD